MSDALSDIWKLRKRGQRDSERHKELIKKSIKNKAEDIITEYDIIKSDGTKKVKIPIKFLERYRFKYSSGDEDKDGAGHSAPGKPGDKYKIGDKSKEKDGMGPGNESGERIFEAELTVDEVVDMMLEEINLPWLKDAAHSEIEIETEEYTSRQKKGIFPNLDIKRTLINNIKRNIIKGTKGIGNFHQDDLLFRADEPEVERHSNAAVYMMMDCSGSMDKDKRDIAKIYYFWMSQFLKRKYKNIHFVFIAHDSEASIASEEEFFKLSGSGGTMCSSAFKLAHEHIEIHHPPANWNNYIYEFTDGDNYSVDNPVCLEWIEKLLPLCRAVGYGEVVPKSEYEFSRHSLLSNYLDSKINRTRFVTHSFESKADIFQGLKKFFNIENSAKNRTKK